MTRDPYLGNVHHMISNTIIESSIEVAIAGVELARKSTMHATRFIGLQAARDAINRVIDYVESGPSFPGSIAWTQWARDHREKIVIAMDATSVILDDILDRHEHFKNSIRNVRTA